MHTAVLFSEKYSNMTLIVFIQILHTVANNIKHYFFQPTLLSHIIYCSADLLTLSYMELPTHSAQLLAQHFVAIKTLKLDV